MDVLPSIAGKTKVVEATFERLIGQIESDAPGIATPIGVDAVTDALDRFKLWAGNIGARQPRSSLSSLESRLEGAEYILEHVLSLLNDITIALEDLSDIVSGKRGNRLISACAGYSDGEALSLSGLESSPEKHEAQNILDAASECIRGLFKTSVIVRKATSRDRFAKALQTREDRFIDHYDINYVADRYPKLRREESRWLCERLGRAITNRRQFLRYTRDHGGRIAGGEGDTELKLAPEKNESKSAAPVNAKGHDAPSSGKKLPTLRSTKASTLDVRKLQALREQESEELDVQSYLSGASAALEDDAQLRLPTLLEVSRGEAFFECPLCHKIQSFQYERNWRQHGFQDLKAYVCTSGKGRCDLEYFGDPRAWFDHELTHHRHQWRCILCRLGLFQTTEHLAGHARRSHPEILGDDRGRLAIFTSACQQGLGTIPAADCPFCDEWEARLREKAKNSEPGVESVATIVVDAKTFRRHVGSHLEQLAIFAVPRGLNNDGDDDEASQMAAASQPTSIQIAPTSLPNAPSDTSQADPPLHLAAARGDHLEVDRLLKFGADPLAVGSTWDSVIKAADAAPADLSVLVMDILHSHGLLRITKYPSQHMLDSAYNKFMVTARHLSQLMDRYSLWTGTPPKESAPTGTTMGDLPAAAVGRRRLSFANSTAPSHDSRSTATSSAPSMGRQLPSFKQSISAAGVATRILPCEFADLLSCNESYAPGEENLWIDHHLEHMGWKAPRQCYCWFCDWTFTAEGSSRVKRNDNFCDRMNHMRDHLVGELRMEHERRQDTVLLATLHMRGIIPNHVYKEKVMQYSELLSEVTLPGSLSERPAAQSLQGGELPTPTPRNDRRRGEGEETIVTDEAEKGALNEVRLLAVTEETAIGNATGGYQSMAQGREDAGTKE